MQLGKRLNNINMKENVFMAMYSKIDLIPVRKRLQWSFDPSVYKIISAVKHEQIRG